MIAGEHKTIIEVGADFILKLKVTDAIGAAIDITDYTIAFTIKYDNVDVINYLDNTGTLSDTPYSFVDIGVTDGPVGELEVRIDKAITALMPPNLTTEASTLFSTEYNYFYTLDINHAGTSEDLRVLRGKLAIRN